MKIIDILAAIGTAILDLVFPRTCIVCGKIIPLFQKVSICDNCAKKYSAQPPMIATKIHGCDLIMSPFPYKGEIRHTMLDYKFNGIKYPGYSFAYAIVSKMKDINIIPKKCICLKCNTPQEKNNHKTEKKSS